MKDDCNSSAIASTVEPVIGEVEGKRRRNRRSDHRGSGSRTSIIREQITDVTQAQKLFDAAMEEMAAVPEHLKRWERKNAMLEPMSKLLLVRRFLDSVLKSNGFDPEKS